jgi:hypothetical protein
MKSQTGEKVPFLFCHIFAEKKFDFGVFGGEVAIM